MSNLFDDFIIFCSELGINSEYFNNICFDYSYCSITPTFEKFFEDLIKSDIICEQLVKYFDDFNIHHTQKIKQYYQTNLAHLPIQYDEFDTDDILLEKYENWKVIYVTLHLLQNLGMIEHSGILDKNIFDIVDFHKNSESEREKEFYSKLFLVAKNLDWIKLD